VQRGDRYVVKRSYPRHGGGHHGHHGHHDHYYHHHHWHHHDYYCYSRYWPFAPAFWAFYFAPFPAPWHHTWIWIGAPWYVAWGWYYQPYPVYVGPSYWVTDYTLARLLADEYERGYVAGQEAAEAAAGAPITEPVKEQVRVQVEATATAFAEERPLTLEQALADPAHLFIVDAPLSVVATGGTSCDLTGGDILRVTAAGAPADAVARLMVVTAKREDCKAGSEVAVAYADLQEMLNSFGAAVDDGLAELDRQRGTIPANPDASASNPK